MKTFSSRSFSVVGCVSAFFLGLATSYLPASTPTISLDVAGGGSWQWNPSGYSQGSDGMWELDNPVSYSAGDSTLEVLELGYDADPIVFNNILLRNNSGVIQSYTITVTLPTVFGAPNIMRGSIDTSVIGTDALVSAPVNGSIYSALIDGFTVRTLQDDPFALGTGQAATSDFVSFANEPNAVPVTNKMAIQLTFDLSPGDDLAILSDFEIVPEPTSAALVLLGSALILFKRRRD